MTRYNKACRTIEHSFRTRPMVAIHIFLFTFLLFGFIQPTVADEAVDSAGNSAAENTTEETAESSAEEEDIVASAREERRDILLYGIDSQVLEVIEKIKDERDELLIDDVYVAFKVTKNPEIKIAAIDFFGELAYYEPIDDAMALIADWEFERSDLVIRAMSYVGYERNDSVADAVLPLTDAFDTSLAQAAIRCVGKTGSETHVEALLERFDDSNFEDDLKPEIILAFGVLKSEIVVDTLIEILDNPDESLTWRRYACDSLGKIGDPRAIPAIERALVSEDANLRAYAVSSIRYFEDVDVAPALMQGLRDSFWRVRISAAQALGDLGAESALPILSFKARKDPETNVRDEAIRAIAAIGTAGSTQAFDTIREYYEDTSFPLALRITCVQMLCERDPAGSIDSFRRVIVAEIDERDSKILERTGYYLSLIDSAHTNESIPSTPIEPSALEPFYAKLLDSGNLVLVIYGIRGAERNRIASLKERIQTLSEEGNHRSIRREAIAALENL